MCDQGKKQPNMQKHLNYKEQFKRLNRALSNGFNLEAIFIEYAIIEDRTESIIRHSGCWDAYIRCRKGHSVTLDSKIRFIQKNAECKKDLMHRYFADNVLEQLLDWKEKRNRLIHALLKQQLGDNDIYDLAVHGNDLVKVLRNKSGNYNRAIERLHNEM